MKRLFRTLIISSWVSQISVLMLFISAGCDSGNVSTEYHENGIMSSRYEFTFDEKGRKTKNGKCVNWDSKGRKTSEGTYKNGKADGRVTILCYDEHPYVYTINFEDGIRNGLLSVHHQDGHKKAEVMYKDDVEEWMKMWDDNGNQITDIICKNGYFCTGYFFFDGVFSKNFTVFYQDGVFQKALDAKHQPMSPEEVKSLFGKDDLDMREYYKQPRKKPRYPETYP